MAKIIVHFDSGHPTSFRSNMEGRLAEVPQGKTTNVEGRRQGPKLQVCFLDVKSWHWSPSITFRETSNRKVVSVDVDHSQ